MLSAQNLSDPRVDKVFAMSSLDLSDVMDEFSQFNVLPVIVSCILVVRITLISHRLFVCLIPAISELSICEILCGDHR